ncbi:MAG: tetratricopeptide repeat protein [Steroidobacteraceae bacterium]
MVAESHPLRTSIGLAVRLCALAVVCTACAVPEPYRPPAPAPGPSPGSAPTVPPSPPATQPTPPPPVVESRPLPEPSAPVVREPVLGPAAKSLVAQAQSQLAARNYPVASASIERALRIEPENPLLWLELAKVRQAEGNYSQAENLARRALSRSTQAPKAQATAWSLIAESYRARGRNTEARQAQARSEMLSGG